MRVPYPAAGMIALRTPGGCTVLAGAFAVTVRAGRTRFDAGANVSRKHVSPKSASNIDITWVCAASSRTMNCTVPSP